MAGEKPLKILKQGAIVWDEFRKKNLMQDYDLSGAKLARLDLHGVNLCGCNLSRADLQDAKLSDAYFIRANLSGANLSKADLRNSSFREANLTRADLRGANLHGADLIDAKVAGAKYSEETQWPTNYDALAYGAILTAPRRPSAGIEIRFSPALSPAQIKSTLEALADYFRGCGGVGFIPDFEVEEVSKTVRARV